MGLRITTWNVNGIRNPFGYQPWRENKTYQAMFDTLEADIVIMQETKIQRKDLQDDMVLVPGWDVYFSLPKHKKGYSGVAIYTRNSKCCPIRAEEGITGVLCPPNSTTKFRDFPEDQQIGGYPKPSQLSMDDALLDSEGRCVVLEFPAFVLIGVYSPAMRDETRIEFRQAFIDALDTRIRNLVAIGKEVFLCGDLNIIRSELDTAGLQDRLKKEGMTYEQFISMPSRRFFNQFVFGGKVFGERDEGREQPVMWDICREFHPIRQGMYTCWETKKNARPGNYGSRIDYVLCTSGIKGWFVDANIQEGLLGSDHCPVYATLADSVTLNGKEIPATDLMNPEGMFKDGKRLREWSNKDILPTSAKLIPEFDRRRNIRDMFTKKPSTAKQEVTPNLYDTSVPLATCRSTSANSDTKFAESDSQTTASQSSNGPVASSRSNSSSTMSSSQAAAALKRPSGSSSSSGRPQKMIKPSIVQESSAKGAGLSQKSLMGFFKPKTPVATSDTVTDLSKQADGASDSFRSQFDTVSPFKFQPAKTATAKSPTRALRDDTEDSAGLPKVNDSPGEKVFDPIVSKESWSKLLGKRIVPKCEHDDDCQILVTKKPGINRGRSFFMCARPLGPSGEKEQGTEFRCGTFIWSSDWSGRQ